MRAIVYSYMEGQDAPPGKSCFDVVDLPDDEAERDAFLREAFIRVVGDHVDSADLTVSSDDTEYGDIVVADEYGAYLYVILK